MTAEVIAIIISPIVATILAAILNRKLSDKPRLLTYLSHTSATSVKTPDGNDTRVHTHTIVIKNQGRKPALNVRLGHTVLPDFSIYPSIEYTTNKLPDGSKEIVIPRIIPKQQIIVNYLYFPPLIWNQVNSYTISDEGYAKVVDMQLSPKPSKLFKALITFLSLTGTSAFAYLLVRLIVWIISFVH